MIDKKYLYDASEFSMLGAHLIEMKVARFHHNIQESNDAIPRWQVTDFCNDFTFGQRWNTVSLDLINLCTDAKSIDCKVLFAL